MRGNLLFNLKTVCVFTAVFLLGAVSGAVWAPPEQQRDGAETAYQPVRPVSDRTPLSETLMPRVRLRLHGTYLDEDNRYALLSVIGGESRRVRVNEPISPGIELIGVDRDSIRIHQHESLQKLTVAHGGATEKRGGSSRSDGNTSTGAAAEDARSAGDRIPPARRRFPEGVHSSGVVQVAEHRFRVDFDDVKRQLLQPATHKHAELVRRDEGMVIDRIAEGSLFEAAGLKNGDQIQNINGRTVQSPHDFISLYGDIAPGKEVKMELSRGGATEVLYYAIE